MSDDMLLRTVAVDAAKYAHKDLELAREELRRRNLPVLTAEEYAVHYKAALPKAPPGEFCSKSLAETVPAFSRSTSSLALDSLAGMTLVPRAIQQSRKNGPIS